MQEKTGLLVKVPIHSIALKILDKRGGEFPKMISQQNFREYVKTICEKAKLHDRVLVKIRDGQPEYKKKFEALTPHIARRTFVQSLYYGWFGKPMPASLVNALHRTPDGKKFPGLHQCQRYRITRRGT